MAMREDVGSLLAGIADAISDGQRTLGLAKQDHWGQDEYDLLKAFERTLDEAKKDFQELSLLVKGQSHYEYDRSFESIEELRALRTRFQAIQQDVSEWNRAGGPVNPIWTRDLRDLQRRLHQAQCRAARRVFATTQESIQRCLGAYLVHRTLRSARKVPPSEEDPRRQLEETLVCNTVGTFERFGDSDIAFICDFCDGHIVWEDLERVPTTREAQGPDEWQAPGITLTDQQPKDVVFAPVAVSNHIPPTHGDWEAPLLCPLCEAQNRQARDMDDEEDTVVADNRYDDLTSLQEHLEWEHGAATAVSGIMPSAQSCLVM